MKKICMQMTLLVLSMLMIINIFGFNTSIKALTQQDCIKSNLSDEEKAACRVYQSELNKEASSLSKELNSIQSQLADMKKEIADSIRLANEYEEQMEQIQADIEQLNQDILDVENNIEELKIEIQITEDKVEEIDNNIKSRLVAVQEFNHVNSYIDFFMGAKNFVDLIRRVEAIRDVQAYDDYLLDLLNEQLIILQKQKEDLEYQQEMLEDVREQVKLKLEYVAGLKAIQDELIAEYYRQKAELEAAEQKLVSDLTSVKNAIKEVSEALNYIAPSDGWTKPIPSGHLSASTWHYPASFGGAVHLGIDVAGVSEGTSIKAVANGYIMFSANACSTRGYLGNYCGYPGTAGGGNQVYLLCTIDGRTYCVKYLHMQYNSPIAMGKIVNAGDVIGKVGRTGNATGAHCHIEIFYLGTESVSYYANVFAEKGDLSWGCGYGKTGLSNTCDKKGAPCRLQPGHILGYE